VQLFAKPSIIHERILLNGRGCFFLKSKEVIWREKEARASSSKLHTDTQRGEDTSQRRKERARRKGKIEENTDVSGFAALERLRTSQ